jgi:hypothetical protein
MATKKPPTTEELDNPTQPQDEPAATSSPDAVADKLAEFGIADPAIVQGIKDLGVEAPEDLIHLEEPDLIKVGLNPIQARKLLAAVCPTPAVEPTVQVDVNRVLPNVPDDGSWLEALKVGGVLKVDESTIIAVIRVGLANRTGFFAVPEKLTIAMEKYAELNEEPVSAVFYKLRKQLTRQNYGDLFAALDGMDGRYVTGPAKKELAERVDRHMWPAIISFKDQLNAWVETWTKGMNNPMAMMAALMSQGRGGAVPPGMMQPSDTAGLHDYAESVADAINKAFAGTGVQIAAAQAYEATQIRKTLEDMQLPGLVGAANRDQMLKQLGVAVSGKYPRLETHLIQYVLGILRLKDQPSGQDEWNYLWSLCMLGGQIEWDQLAAPSTTSGVATFR